MYNCILNSLEKKEISCFVFCDFSKAFADHWGTPAETLQSEEDE
jgi:hypothetical protein